MTRALARLLLALVTAPAAIAAFQNPVYRASTDVVSVDVSVRDGNRPVQGLAAEDFEVLDNGVAQHIDLVSRESLPIDLTLLIDTSRSVQGRLLQRLKTSVTQTAAILSPADALRVIAMGSRVREVIPFQPGGQRPFIDALDAEGGTSLFDGLAMAMMRPTEATRRQLIVAYTDGLDTLSVLAATTAADVAHYADAVVQIVVTTDPARGKPPAGPNAVALREIAERTGGQLFMTHVNDPIGEAFKRAIDEFRTSYVLRYVPAGVKREGWHDITVRVKTGKYDVRARKGYQGDGSR